MKPRKIILTIILLNLVVTLMPSKAVYGDSVTDTITICIGYFGWSEDEYIEKASYHWSDLDDLYGGVLDTHEEVYSYYSGTRMYLVKGRGFYVSDLLELAGVDINSIARIDFFTKDHKNGAYRSFTRKALFDTPRYYFPYLAANEETGELFAIDNSKDLWRGATQVEAMLALEDYSDWLEDGCASGSEFEQLANSNLYSTGSRFHLLFGQSDPSEKGTSSAAKYVYKILVTFNGSPEIGLEETDLSLKIGSDHSLTTTIYAEDDLLNDYVRQNMTWTSSDESVVKVDSNGNLTPVGKGTAVITGTYGETSVSTVVTVGDEEKEGDSSAADKTEEAKKGVYILSSSVMDESPRPSVISSGEHMSDDATQLVVTKEDKISLTATWCVLAAFVILGVLFELIRFNKLRR